MYSSCSEQNLVPEGLCPSERKKAPSPKGSGNQGNVLQSSLIGFVSSQDLSNEGSHIGTDATEVTGSAQVGSQGRCEGVLKSVG